MLEVNFDPFPVLKTNSLLLRKIDHNDVPALFSMRSDKETMRYIDRPIAETFADAEQLIERIDLSLANNDGITWGISLKENNELIGTIGYWRMIKEHYRAEIGYLLHPAQQGRGLMQEAITAVINFGFNII
jgi:ribosomal-protein-alanine N-acetyltransferase